MNDEKNAAGASPPGKEPGWKKALASFFNSKKNMYGVIALAVLAMLLAQYNRVMSRGDEYPVIPYPEFLEALDAGEVDGVYYNQNYEYMTVTFFNDETRGMAVEEREEYEYPDGEYYRVKYPGNEGFRERVLASGAIATRVTPFELGDLIADAFTVLMMGSLVLMLFAVMKSGPLSMLSNSAKALLKTSDVKFSDVIGQEETIEDLKFIVDLMKDPGIGKAVGARVPKGLLLQGPPGTGKTMLAKAVAGEAGVPFIQQSASAFIEMYVGVGAKRVRELFALARKNAPCIIFIDEIDAVGGKRDKAGSTSENDQTINALLEQMDGFDAREGVFVIAATNRADQLDEALVRPGRFDRQVAVNPPADWRVRAEMFAHYLKRLSLSDDIDIDAAAKQLPGFTGADIAAVCNEAGMIAVMADKKCVDMACLEEAIDKKVFMGSRSKRKQFEKDRHVVAWHEAGHAVMSWLLGAPVSRASIQSTTSGVGGAVFGADRESRFMTKKDFRNRIMIAYAGRASEEIKFDSVTTGASSDITKATQLLVQYVERLGFDQKTGLLDMSVLMRDHLVDTADTAKAMREVSNELYAEAMGLLKANYHCVDVLAECLLAEESISGASVANILAKAQDEIR